jgi:hypothetical protein
MSNQGTGQAIMIPLCSVTTAFRMKSAGHRLPVLTTDIVGTIRLAGRLRLGAGKCLP